MENEALPNRDAVLKTGLLDAALGLLLPLACGVLVFLFFVVRRIASNALLERGALPHHDRDHVRYPLIHEQRIHCIVREDEGVPQRRQGLEGRVCPDV